MSYNLRSTKYNSDGNQRDSAYVSTMSQGDSYVRGNGGMRSRSRSLPDLSDVREVQETPCLL